MTQKLKMRFSALVAVALLGGPPGVAAFQPASTANARRFGGVRSTTTSTSSFRMATSPDGPDADEAVGASASPRRSGRRTTEKRRLREKARTFGQLLSERMDTMGAAGYRDDEEAGDEALEGQQPGDDALSRNIRSLVPLQAGVVKTGLQVAVVVWLVRKWMKTISKDKMLKGDTITEADDAELHAWTCNNCGATLYVAKGKEWRYFPKNYKCYLCGNKGQENFVDTRSEIIERVGDNYEFLDPWDALTPKEQKELLKECGGDEEKAQLKAVEMAADKAEAEKAELRAATEEAVAGADALLGIGEDEEGEEGGAPDGAEGGAETEAKAEGSEGSSGDDSSAEAAPAAAPAPAPEAKTKPAGDEGDFDALDMDM